MHITYIRRASSVNCTTPKYVRALEVVKVWASIGTSETIGW